MRREPQLDLAPALSEFETGSEIVPGGESYYRRLEELHWAGYVIESVETVRGHNGSWKVNWRRKRTD